MSWARLLKRVFDIDLEHCPTERLHKKPFAVLRPSGPVQQWIFHQTEKELTTLPGLRYSSGRRKGRLKFLSIPIHRDHHETSPPTISASGRGRGRAAGSVAYHLGASLSDAARAHHRWFCTGRHGRYHRASDRSVAVGATRPGIHHRQSTGCGDQYRYRNGRQSSPGRLYASIG